VAQAAAGERVHQPVLDWRQRGGAKRPPSKLPTISPAGSPSATVRAAIIRLRGEAAMLLRPARSTHQSSAARWRSTA